MDPVAISTCNLSLIVKISQAQAKVKDYYRARSRINAPIFFIINKLYLLGLMLQTTFYPVACLLA